MQSVRICAVAITAVCAMMIVRQWKSDFLPLLRLGTAVLIAAALFGLAAPVVSFLRELTANTAVAEYGGILFKAFGIAVLTEISSGICRECGENGVAGGVEIAGKAEILLLCLPLLEEVLSLARELLSMGDAG